MNKDEIKQRIINNFSSLFTFVGPNSSGKSYTLNYLYNTLGNKTLMFDERGLLKCNVLKSKIIINNDIYIYENNKNYGAKKEEKYEVEKISIESTNIIEFIKKVLYRLPKDNNRLSQGQIKLKGMFEAFLNYNLNNIDYFIFDEPENYLDDNNLKAIKELFDLLIDNNKKIIFSTHNSRLLELVKPDIGNIYIFNSYRKDNINNYSFSDVCDIYEESSKICKSNKHLSGISKHKKYWFSAQPTYRNIYIKILIESQEFYRSLFYNKIILLEGKTEELVLRETKNIIDNLENVFIANGKYQMPFLIILFYKICGNILCVYDSDYKDGKKEQEAYFFNEILINIKNKYNSIKLIELKKDLEATLGIDFSLVAKDLFEDDTLSPNEIKSIKNDYKANIVYYAVRKDPNLISKLNSIFIKDKWEF